MTPTLCPGPQCGRRPFADGSVRETLWKLLVSQKKTPTPSQKSQGMQNDRAGEGMPIKIDYVSLVVWGAILVTGPLFWVMVFRRFVL
jgi:hypothetical protein